MRERASLTQAGEWYSTSVLPHLHVGKRERGGGGWDRRDGSGVAGLTSTTESTRTLFQKCLARATECGMMGWRQCPVGCRRWGYGCS